MLKEEVKKIIYRKQFIIIFIVLLGAVMADFLITCKNYYGIELSRVRSAYKCGILTNEIGLFTKQFFGTLFPLIVCTAVADIFCVENAKGITNFIYSRTTTKKNILSKVAAVIVVSFFMIFIPLVINFFLTFTAFPMQGYYCTNASYLTLTSPEEGRILGYLEMFYPYWNCMVYIFIRSILGCTLAVFSFSLSLLKYFNRYVILFSGMVYYLCYSSIVGLPPFSDTIINTNLFFINGYGSGWMILVFLLFTWMLSGVMVWCGIKRETY